VIALNLTIDRPLPGIILVYYGIMAFVGATLGVEDRLVVEWLIRLGKLLLLVACGFTGSATDAAGKVDEYSHPFRVPFK
jgi:hypothetical protein